ncbi:hypothetical protein HK100_008157 [Physocladia obscura]|uniref:Protein kinase domain-containing protein n=1 Tax=Physocladia obscura TaxID=109957 RepID=A0AAD5SNH5_9FUNG|nr:hypothetical protein HK100_008157 [Physocladia obscura]
MEPGKRGSKGEASASQSSASKPVPKKAARNIAPPNNQGKNKTVANTSNKQLETKPGPSQEIVISPNISEFPVSPESNSNANSPSQTSSVSVSREQIAVTSNITELSQHLFITSYDENLNIPNSNTGKRICTAACTNVLKEITHYEKMDQKAKELNIVQDAVETIFLAGLESFCKSSFCNIFLWREVSLPSLTVAANFNNYKTLAMSASYPYSGIADFGLGFSETASTVQSGKKFTWAKDKKNTAVTKEAKKFANTSSRIIRPMKQNTPDSPPVPTNYLRFIVPFEVKTVKSICKGVNNSETKTFHPPAIIQAASYAFYCILQILSHLSDDEKTSLLGADISIYTLAITHESCHIIKVSLRGFSKSGLVSVTWGKLLKAEKMASAVVDFIAWSVKLLYNASKFSKKLIAEPQYCWMPLSEYRLKFFDEIKDDAVATSMGTFTNPVLQVNGRRVYRLYHHILSKTKDSMIDILHNKITLVIKDQQHAREVAIKDQQHAREVAIKDQQHAREVAIKDQEVASLKYQLAIKNQETAIKDQEAAFKDQETGFKDQETAIKDQSNSDDTIFITVNSTEMNVNITSFLDPFDGWIFNYPFISMPYFGNNLYHIIFSKEPPTPNLIKELYLSVIEKLLLALEFVEYAHMDIRPSNIVLSKDDWSDARLIDYDFCQPAGKLNPMEINSPQYPPEQIVHANSDVWMLGFILLRLGICGSEWEKMKTQQEIESWVKNRTIGAIESDNINALNLAARCLLVDPAARICVSELKAIVAAWNLK